MLRDRLGVSERWACRVAGQHRSTQRHELVRAEDDTALRAELRQFSVDRPRWSGRITCGRSIFSSTRPLTGGC